MFVIGYVIGIFSYLILLLGVLGFLYSPLVITFTVLYWFGYAIWQRKTITIVILNMAAASKKLIPLGEKNLKRLPRKKNLLTMTILLGITLQTLINLIGVFGPEIGFDATWYHLTLPKFFLHLHAIQHISGGLLYYSDMPKLTEMLFIPGIIFLQETGAKLIHFLFGILCCIALYKLGRKFFNPLLSLCAVGIFYSNLVVGWESISAYIDLARTFFEILTFWAFIYWVETKESKWLVQSAIYLGLGICTKFLTLMDVGIFLPLVVLITWKNKYDLIKKCILFIAVALVIPTPWWIYSYIQTGNAFYPFFTPLYPTITSLNFTPFLFLQTVWNAFTHSADPISPMYIAFLPFLFLVKNWDKKTIVLACAGVLSILIWYVSPQTGGGRFLLAYLPVLSLLVVLVYKNSKGKYVQWLFVGTLILNLLISIGYRTLANAKFVPVALGRESKAEFLAHHLNFSFGDWYDIDGYMAKTIKPTDMVLLYGYHNLYYMDFPYIHESWVKKGDRFNYLATSGGLPSRFKTWKLIYQNTTTHMHLYYDGGKVWTY